MTLTDRLMAAIDAREATAQAAKEDASGQWFVGRKWNVYQVEDETPYDDEETNRLVVYGNALAASEHIADNDPAAVLRMCQAHRELVELHAGEHECRCVHTGTYPDDSPPSYGTPGEAWRHVCFEYYDEPCPTLRAIAAGYGLTEEDT